MKNIPRLITISILLCVVSCHSQITKQVTPQKEDKHYTDKEVCISFKTHKGKKDHGKSYCVGWAYVREHKDGCTDTLGWIYGGESHWGDEIGKYEKLPERGRYIVDSLKEDGITQYDQSYLSYEPIYMKSGEKTEQLWAIRGEDIVIYEYLFWKSNAGNGIRLIKDFIVK